MYYGFWIERTKIENAIFPYKTTLSKASVKTNRMGVPNGPITRNRVLPLTALFFKEFCSSINSSHN